MCWSWGESWPRIISASNLPLMVPRVGEPVDVADVVVWLAGDESRFVTGQVITIDGGRTTRPPLPDILG